MGRNLPYFKREKIRVINLYIYSYLKQNRNNVFSRILNYKSITVAQDTNNSLISCDTTVNTTEENVSMENVQSDNKVTRNNTG